MSEYEGSEAARAYSAIGQTSDNGLRVVGVEVLDHLRAERDAAVLAEQTAILRTLRLIHKEHCPTFRHAAGVEDCIAAVLARIAVRTPPAGETETPR